MINKTDFICINVKTSKTRKEHMTTVAKKYKIPLRFFDAITPKTIATVPNRYSKRRTKFWWGRELMPTEKACSLSHIKIWRDFLNSDFEYLIVFEDDLDIESDFMEVVRATLALPIVPDFIKFSGQHERPSKWVCQLGVKNYALYNNAVGPLDTICYLLTKKGAVSLEKYCTSMHSSIDVLMDRTYSHKVPCYTIRPYPTRQNSGLLSDIGDRIKYDSNQFSRIITRLLRAYSSLKKRLWRIRWSKAVDPVKEALEKN